MNSKYLIFDHIMSLIKFINYKGLAMRKILIFLFCIYLTQINTLVVADEFVNDVKIIFIKESTGANLLRIIESSHTNSSEQFDSFNFLMGYLEGIDNASRPISDSVSSLGMEYKKLQNEHPKNNKISKEELDISTKLAYAMSISPVGLMIIPNGVTLGQRTLIIEKYLRDHPERLHEPAYNLVVKAFLEAFSDKR
jgi:hypothetical protein